MTKQQLIEKRANLWEQTKAFLESHTEENGKVSPENYATYEKMEADVSDYTKQIEALDRQEAIDRKLSTPTASPIIERPSTGIETPQSFRASKEYKNAMLKAFRTNFREVKDLREGEDAEGGYLVPEEMDSRLIDVLEEENVMRGLATKITTTGDHKINFTATKPSAAWMDEGEALTFTDATFAQKMLDAHKLGVAVQVTEELLYDNAFNLEGYITKTFGSAIANAEEDAFLNGDGKSKPEGLFTAATVAGTVKAITGDSVMDLVYALKRPYRKSAQFILNDKTLSAIRKLKDNNGAYIWQPSYQAGEPDKLLGYTVRTSAYAPEDAIAFGDYSYYNIADRGTRTFQKLSELYAVNGKVGFVTKERVDGMLLLPEAVQVLKVSAS